MVEGLVLLGCPGLALAFVLLLLFLHPIAGEPPSALEESDLQGGAAERVSFCHSKRNT